MEQNMNVCIYQSGN